MADAARPDVAARPHPVREFLLERDAGRLPHPGGTLYEHVTRVAEQEEEHLTHSPQPRAGPGDVPAGLAGYQPYAAGLAA